MDIDESYNQEILEEINQYKKINKRNDVIIFILSIILVLSLLVMVYVRFFA